MHGAGPFSDRRSPFVVFVTGHRDAVPGGRWQHSVLERASLDVPGAPRLYSYLDAVLYRRRDAHRLSVHCRGGRPHEAGIDALVRAYCESRGIPCLPEHTHPDAFGAEAKYRRDLATVAAAHAVVWFGGRESGCDPVALAELLDVPVRVVPLLQEA